MKILAKSTLSSRAQITLPRIVRQMLDVRAGDSVVWMMDEGGRLLISGRRSYTLADIRAAVAAAGRVRIPKGIAVEHMKAGIAARMRSRK